MVFTAKKVEEIPSFSEKLRKAREGLGLSKEKVGQLLNFPVKYLEYLERGELDKLPADIYSKGFLRKYAKALDIEPNLLVLEFEKEIKIIRHLDKGFNEHPSLPSLRSSRWIITPKTLGAGIGIVIAFLVVGYLAYQLHFLISPPSLAVIEPAPDSVAENSLLTVRGTVEAVAKLTINGQMVYVDKDGSFKQEVQLSQGLNVIRVEATNRFGKMSSIVRQVMLR
jgi:cytoskeletal protein RodZ